MHHVYQDEKEIKYILIKKIEVKNEKTKQNSIHVSKSYHLTSYMTSKIYF